MAIHDDWEELKGLWGKCSAPTRIFLLVSFVVSCLSIASLADHVFAFKGFILAGIEFYRIPINYLIEVVKEKIDFEIPILLFDGIICCVLIVSSIERAGVVVFGYSHRFKVTRDTIAPVMWSASLVYFYFVIFSGFNLIELIVTTLLWFPITIALFTIVDLFWAFIFSLRSKGSTIEKRGQVTKVSLVYMLAIVFLMPC